MTGWPWPLEGVQSFFEGMWQGIVQAVSSAGQWLWGQIWSGLNWLADRVREGATWLWERLSEFGGWLWGQISGGLNWIWERIQEIGSAIINAIAGGIPAIGQAIQDFINAIISPIQSGLSWLLEQIQNGLSFIGLKVTEAASWVFERMAEGLSSLGSQLQAGVSWLWDSFSRGIADLATSTQTGIAAISAQLGESYASITSQVSQSTSLLAEQLSQGVGWLYSELIKYADGVMTSIAQALQLLPEGFRQLITQMIETLSQAWLNVAQSIAGSVSQGQVAAWQPITTQLAAPVGSISPQLALTTAQQHEIAGHALWAALFAATTIGEAATLGQLDISLQGVWNEPYIRAMMDTTQAIISLPTQIGIITPLQYQLNAQYTPSLPSPAEMISFMVKEAYYPEKQVELPDIFVAWMKWLGYKEEWTRLFWGAHWRLPDTGQVFTMLHRKLLTPEQVDAYLKLADIEPAWRPLLRAISYDLPDKIRTRWMYEWGLIDVATWRMLDEMTGLSPEWSGLMVQAELKNILRDDINAVRSELHRQAREGLISLAEYETFLRRLGLPEPVIALRVDAARLARDTDAKIEMIKALRQAYIDKKIGDAEYVESMTRLGVSPDALSIFSQVDSLKREPKPIPPETLEKKLADLSDRIKKYELALTQANEDLAAMQTQMAEELQALETDLEKKLADIDDRIRILTARYQFAKTVRETELIRLEIENLLNEKAQLIQVHQERYDAAKARWDTRILQAQQKIREIEIELTILRDRFSRLAGKTPAVAS